MGVVFAGDRIALTSPCRIEDAETLTAMLQAHPSAGLDLSACEMAHTAVFQVILAFAPTLIAGPPAGSVLAGHMASLVALGGQADGDDL